MDPAAQAFENAATNIQNAFSNTFRDIFDDGIDGFKGLADRIGDIFKRDTLMFNGYAEEVAELYDDLDLRVNF